MMMRTMTTTTAIRLTLAALVLAPSLLRAQDTIPLPAADRPLEIRLEPLFEVGALDGQAWEEFQSLDGAVFGHDGRLYLRDEGSPMVVAVGAYGRFLHRAGGPGDGPGEYRGPAGMVELPDGRIAVWDLLKRAFLLYGADGAHLDEVRPDLATGLPGPPLALARDGSVLALADHLLTGRLGHAYLTSHGVRAADGALPFLRIPLADDAPARVVTEVRIPVPEGPPPHPVRRAFEPLPSWGPLADDRIALSHSADYRIEILGPDGRLERVLTRPLRARAITAADRDAFRREQAGNPTRTLGAGGGGGTPPRPSDFWFSPVVPPVLAITADGRDHIWVLRRDPDDPTRPGPVDVLSAAGRYLGTIPHEILSATGGDSLPASFGPDGRVVFLGRGTLDVPVARVYRLLEQGR